MTYPPEVDPHLLLFLRGRDVSCPGCAYNLRDLTADRCPECGQQLELAMRLVEPRQGALIAGLVGLAAGAGFGGLLLLFILIVRVVDGPAGGPSGEILGITSTGFVAHGLVLWLWVRNWGRIRRVSASARRRLVAVCWAMPLTFIVVFSLQVR